MNFDKALVLAHFVAVLLLVLPRETNAPNGRIIGRRRVDAPRDGGTDGAGADEVD